MNAHAVLADVAELGPYFTVGTGCTGRTGWKGGTGGIADGPGWRPVSDLHTDPVPLRGRIEQVRRVLGCDDRVAASITFQGLAAQLVSAPYAAVVLHRVLPRLDARSLHWRSTERGPWPLCCPDPVAEPAEQVCDGAAALAGLLVEELLAPLVAAVRGQVPIAERVLWGNVASSVAGAKRMLGQGRPASAGRAAAVAARLLTRPPLAGSGVLLPPAGPDRDWTFQRRSCCLYYRVDRGGLCGDCVLLARRG